MASEIIYLTAEGMQKLKDELQHMRSVERPAISAAIAEARDKGDLSENAEYDAAKDEQREIELRIEEIDKILKNAEVVDDDNADNETVNIGCTVKIKDIEFDEEIEYKIVGSTEADCLNGKISNESPVGAALIGAKVGKKVSVETPSGEMVEYEVLEIRR